MKAYFQRGSALSDSIPLIVAIVQQLFANAVSSRPTTSSQMFW